MSGRDWTTSELDALRSSYGKMHPGELGRRIGRTRSAVHQKAAKLGMAFDRRAEFGPDFDAFFSEKYRDGWCDKEIADAWGACVGTVGAYRRSHRLASNRSGLRTLAKIRANTRRQCRENSVKNLAELRSMVWRARTFYRGWGNVTPLQADILDHLEAGPKTRRMLCAAMGRPWRGCKSLTNHAGNSVMMELVRMGKVRKYPKRVRREAGSGCTDYVYGLADGVARIKQRGDAA